MSWEKVTSKPLCLAVVSTLKSILQPGKSHIVVTSDFPSQLPSWSPFFLYAEKSCTESQMLLISLFLTLPITTKPPVADMVTPKWNHRCWEEDTCNTQIQHWALRWWNWCWIFTLCFSYSTETPQDNSAVEKLTLNSSQGRIFFTIFLVSSLWVIVNVTE